MSVRRQNRATSEEMARDDAGCEDRPRNQVGEGSTSGSNQDVMTSDRLELPFRKNSRSFFGSLKKRFSSNFHRKRNSSHGNSSGSYSFSSSAQHHHENDSSSAESDSTVVKTRTRDKGLRFISRVRARSSSDVSHENPQHSNGTVLNGLRRRTLNHANESENISADDRRQTAPYISRNGSVPNHPARIKTTNEVVQRNIPLVQDGESRTNDSSYGFYTKIPPVYDQVKTVSEEVWCLTKELLKLSKHGWYWGPISRMEAEEKLADQEDGSFLVRDSSDERYLLSLSFRSSGKTLHTRVEHCNGVFSFYAQPESEGYPSVIDLIENSMTDSRQGIFCYSRSRYPGSPAFPVRLTKPLSRFAQVRTLQYLCRFVIRQATRLDHIQTLPLPTSIKGWLTENQY